MKTSISKFAVVTALLVVGLIAFNVVTTLDMQAASYTKSKSVITVTNWGNYLRFSHTFVTRTDTVYMPFQWDRPNSPGDTLLGIVNLKTIYSDSNRVVWTYQYSDDNTNWSTAKSIGTDSADVAAATVNYRTIEIGASIEAGYGGWQPYARFVAAGATLATGISNEIGNQLQVNILEPSGTRQ